MLVKIASRRYTSDMATRLDTIREERIKKLEELKKLHINPYPSKITLDGKHSRISDAIKSDGKEMMVAGRVMGMRGHGAIIFGDLRDESGQIQTFFKEDNLKTKYKELKLIDTGDFIAVKGKIIKTQAGEVTVEVSDFQLLTKSIRPLPEKREGLKDQELIFRKRYLDLVMNPDRREMFIRKSRFWEANREFMKQNGFLEVETPVLEHVTGGADAKPFVTHHNALDEDFYLRISTELYQKRLIGGGFEKIYTLAPNFRNEGIDDEHLQEYYALEWYWAYADYRDNMKLVEECFKFVAKKVYGTTKFTKGNHTFDLNDKWEEIDYGNIIKEKLGIDIFKSSEKEMLEVLKKNGISLVGDLGKPRLVDNLWKIIRKGITGPAFLVNEPKFTSPLAKSKPEDDRLTERFHVIIAGTELGNGYSELNDPLDQIERFKEQQSARDKGDEEAQMLDEDFVEMLEYGMPPTSGYGHSERVFWFLEGVTAREGTFFPQMKTSK